MRESAPSVSLAHWLAAIGPRARHRELPVAFAQAASEAGETRLAAWFGRAPPLRGSGSALAGDAEPAGEWPPSSWQWGEQHAQAGLGKK